MEASCSDRYTWTNLNSLLKSGKLDPETNDIVHKLIASFSISNKATGEQKPVFGVRELEETDFIFNKQTIQETKNEIIDFMQNQSHASNLKVSQTKTSRSRHNSTTQSPNKDGSIDFANEPYVPLLEVPKGRVPFKI